MRFFNFGPTSGRCAALTLWFILALTAVCPVDMGAAQDRNGAFSEQLSTQELLDLVGVQDSAFSDVMDTASSDARIETFGYENLGADRLENALARRSLAQQVGAYIARLEAIGRAVDAGASPEEMASLEEETARYAAAAANLAALIQPLLQSRQRRLEPFLTSEETPDATPAGSGELQSLRADLEAEIDALNSLLRQVEVLRVRAIEELAHISSARRAALAANLLVRTPSILSPDLWLSAVPSSERVFFAVSMEIAAWIDLIRERKGWGGLLLLFAAITLSVFIIFRLRRWLLKRSFRDPSIFRPSLLARTRAGLATILNATMPLIIGFIAVLAVLHALDLATPGIERIFNGLAGAALAIAFASGLARGLLSLDLPQWRVIGYPDAAARRITTAFIGFGVVFAAGYLLISLVALDDQSERLDLLAGGLFSLAIGAFSIVGLRALSLENRREAHRTSKNASGTVARDTMPPMMASFVIVVWVATLISIAAPLLGYIPLGQFVALQIVWTIVVVQITRLTATFIVELLRAAVTQNSRYAPKLANSLGISGSGLEQLGVVAAGIGKLAIYVVAIILLLLPWGLSSGDLNLFLQRLIDGFSVGSAHISFAAIFTALIIFVLGFLGTRGTKRWLERELLSRSSLDIGLKASISTIFGYVGLVLTFIVGVSFAGIDLSSVALVAGALSVGIGLGLQGIVNNFVSGIVLMAERPIKVGDWVVVGQDQGIVKRISVRSTEIATFDNCSVIIPNSDLISGVVQNWMHNDLMGRVVVPVGVAYASDPEKVKELLLRCARAHANVLERPEPQVFFLDFAESSLNFDVRVYVSDIRTLLTTSSELRFMIHKCFKEEGVEIPFPQRDLNIRGEPVRIETISSNASRRSRRSGKKAHASVAQTAALAPARTSSKPFEGDGESD